MGGVVHFDDIAHEDDLYMTSCGFMQEAAHVWGEGGMYKEKDC